jgi:uncharacterized protein YeaO (DUF488 family)
VAERHAEGGGWDRHKDAGCSPALRKWFGHDPALWEGYQEKYFHELLGKPEVIDQLAELVRKNPVILSLFVTKDQGTIIRLP